MNEVAAKNIGKEILPIPPEVEAKFDAYIAESQTRSPEDLYKPYEPIKQEMDIPEFGKCTAEWEFGFGEKGVRWLNLSILKNEQSLADIRIGDRWDGGKDAYDSAQHYFDVRHRLVHRDHMTADEQKIRGVGKYALRAAETSLTKLLDIQQKHRAPDGAQREQVEIGMLTNQPSVIGLARSSEYGIKNKDQEQAMLNLKGEIDTAITKGENSKEYAQYAINGWLPHFRIVNIQLEDAAYSTNEVVIDTEKLKTYCASSPDAAAQYGNLPNAPQEPSAEEIQQLSTSPDQVQKKYPTVQMSHEEYYNRKENMRSESPHPFFLEVYFSKKI